MERRFDPTVGEWRLFAPQFHDRASLPPDYCPMCPSRPGHTPTEMPYEQFDVIVFESRYPSLVKEPPPSEAFGSDLYLVGPSAGVNEVIVYSDDHAQGLAEMDPSRIAQVVEVWADRYAELGRRDDVAYVFIFENRGNPLGARVTHPHGQVYAYPEIPPRPRRELDVALAHLDRHGTCVFCDVVARELADGVRIVAQNRSFLAFVPFAARFPYEIHVMSHRHAASLLDLTDPERLALAELLKRVLVGYDTLFGFPLPYVMSMHQAPSDDGQHQAVSHFHMEFTPVHRTATKLKYLAGSELGAGAFVNDAAPEDSAARLREAAR